MKTVNGLYIPPLYEKIFIKARTSKATAVKANCLACVNFYRAEITNCQVPDCGLFPHRPYQNPVKPPREGLEAANTGEYGTENG